MMKNHRLSLPPLMGKIPAVAKLSSATTGRSRNAKYSNCIPVSQTSAGTTFTRLQQQSAKTTQCLGLGKIGFTPFDTEGWYEMRRQLGYKQFWRYLRHIPASVARAVVIQRKKTACHRVNSSVWRVDIQRTPISTALATF